MALYTLIFGEGISADNLLVQIKSGSDDLQIAIKEDGKTFAQLTNKTTPLILQNYTLLSSINHFKQDILSQSLKKDIIINNFFIFKNTLYAEDIKNRNLLNEAA